MLCDLCRNFQKQLVRTPADSRNMPSWSPFTSEKAHKVQQPKPDGGMMKRVQSQPNLAQPSLAASGLSRMSLKQTGSAAVGEAGEEGKGLLLGGVVEVADEKERSLGASDDNCFLRLHVPHFVGPQVVLAARPSAAGGEHQLTGSTSSGNLAAMGRALTASTSSGNLAGMGSAGRRA